MATDQRRAIGEFKLLRVLYGTEPGSFLAARTIAQAADDNAPDQKTADILKNSMYVDDLVHGADSVEAAREQVMKLHKTMAAAETPLRKWCSNVGEVLRDIPSEDKIDNLLEKDGKSTSSWKLLGLVYSKDNDSLSLAVPDCIMPNPFTRRSALSLVAKLYDSQGFVIPVIVTFRILMQQLWLDSSSVTWDSVVDNDELKEKFKKCIEQLPLLRSISISRWPGCSKTNKLELIAFVDASHLAHCVVAYGRVKISDGDWKVTLLASKARVNPLKTRVNAESENFTTPKFELFAMNLGAELIADLKRCMKGYVKCTKMYSDAMCVLHWVRRTQPLPNKFIEKRSSTTALESRTRVITVRVACCLNSCSKAIG